jgi:hypothetical protein
VPYSGLMFAVRITSSARASGRAGTVEAKHHRGLEFDITKSEFMLDEARFDGGVGNGQLDFVAEQFNDRSGCVFRRTEMAPTFT